MTEIPWGLAACLGCDSEIWFAEGNTQAANEARTEAKLTCLRCPIREGCLTSALTEEKGRGPSSRYGIRGGKSAMQRYGMVRRRSDGVQPMQQRAA